MCIRDSGNYEANASFAGAVSGFSFEDSPLPLAVIDIGGGSTEIGVSSLTDVSKCESYVSIPIGSSRLTERYLHSDPPKPEELTNAIRDVRDSISDAISSNNVLANAKTFIGVAATFTTVGAIEIGLTKFNFDKLHGFVSVSYTHLRAHETVLDLVCRLLLEKKKKK